MKGFLNAISSMPVMLGGDPARPGRVSKHARHPMQRILAQPLSGPGSVDADRRAEGLADRTVEEEVGDCVEAGWLAVDDYQGCAVVFRQFREGGRGINHQ